MTASHENLSLAKSNLTNDNQLSKSLSQKLEVALTEQGTVKPRLSQATANLAAVEKKHILDAATDAELLEARQVHADLAAQAEAVDRRVELIHEAIAENDLKINAAAQNLKIARRDYCLTIRNEKLAKIKQNQQLKELILTAMAAQAANGVDNYYISITVFVQRFIGQILPEISETEVIAATEKFIEENGLD